MRRTRRQFGPCYRGIHLLAVDLRKFDKSHALQSNSFVSMIISDLCPSRNLLVPTVKSKADAFSTSDDSWVVNCRMNRGGP